ncbi:hypothetical protein FQN52_008626 [Onygenales sp. PD_12]|nr:hypothetical protein FQN52_008626 [Onygenales sp. PD_12]
MSGQSRATTSTITTSSLYPTSPSFSDDGRFAYFSPNFAHSGCPPRYTKLQTWELPMQYEHEIYLQLTAGDDGIPEKTANQLHLEERSRHLTTRAHDPAVSDPQNSPSSIDFECAEIQRLRAYEHQLNSSSSSSSYSTSKPRPHAKSNRTPSTRSPQRIPSSASSRSTMMSATARITTIDDRPNWI